MRVREATPEDAEAVQEVHRKWVTGLGPAAYTDEQVAAWARGVEDADYEASITADENAFVVAEVDDVEVRGSNDTGGDVVAFGSLSLSAPDGYEADVDAEVTGVYVRPEVVRQGVGSAVLVELERRARTHGAGRVGLTARSESDSRRR